MNEKIYSDNLLNEGLLGTDTLKKLQEELLKNKSEQVKLIDKKLYYAKNAREKKKQNIKSADLISIKETLNKIYKEFHRKLSTKKITTLEEFEGIILVGLALFDALDAYSLDSSEDEVLKYKSYLEEYRKLKAKKEQYERYARKYATAKEIEGFDLEVKETDRQIKTLEKKLNDFTKTHFTKVFQDYNEFKTFLSETDEVEDKRGQTLKMLAELSTLNSYIDSLPDNENEENVNLKLEIYLENIKEIMVDGIVGNEKLADSISDVMNEMENNGNMINIALHLIWANVLIRNNIMRYAAIAEDYNNSKTVNEIKALRFALIDYYRESLTYENEIPVKIAAPARNIITGIGRPQNVFEKPGTVKKVESEVTEKHYDDLFYDLLILNQNKKNKENLKENESFEEKEYKTFNKLKSTKPSLNLRGRFGNIEINEKTGNVTINCNLEDFILIANSLQAAEVLSAEGSYKKVTNFFESDAEWFQNKKFKLKNRYDTEYDSFGVIMDEAFEIKKELESKGEKLNFIDIKVIYYILSTLNIENEERVKAGILLKDRTFFNFTVRELLKTVEKRNPEENEEIGILEKEKIKSEQNEEIKEESSLYQKRMAKIVNEIRGLIRKAKFFIDEMSKFDVKELSNFESFVKNIKEFDFSTASELKELFQQESEKLIEYNQLQKEFIKSLSGDYFGIKNNENNIEAKKIEETMTETIEEKNKAENETVVEDEFVEEKVEEEMEEEMEDANEGL